MKPIKTFIYTAVVLFLASCDPELESINYDEINPSIFPSSEADVESLVIAAYHPLRGSWSDGIHSTSENGLMFVSDATTEILQGAYGIQQDASLHRYNPSTAGVTRFYDIFYNKISAMTLSIDRIENSSVNENIKKKGIAEIRCARGFLAYELFDLYGPLVIAPLEVLKNPLVEAPLARLSHAETVAFIEQNPLEAIPDLPAADEASYGRFSQGMARMILIRLYLHEKRWNDVLTQANAIIDLNYYGLEADYVGL